MYSSMKMALWRLHDPCKQYNFSFNGIDLKKKGKKKEMEKKLHRKYNVQFYMCGDALCELCILCTLWSSLKNWTINVTNPKHMEGNKAHKKEDEKKKKLCTIFKEWIEPWVVSLLYELELLYSAIMELNQNHWKRATKTK